MKFKGLLVVGIIIMLMIAGCSANDQEEEIDENNHTNDTEVISEEEENDLNSEEAGMDAELDLATDEELTEKVKDTEGVIDGQVYTQDDMAIGTLLIEEGVSEEKIQQLAQQYAEEIKEKYPDMKVNVQAVQNGENKANIVLE